MIIAVASGKGGTGKTTVAVSLALTMADRGGVVTYADCDVEEPNGHIFLKPNIAHVRTVGVPVPNVSDELCTNCGDCAKICQYGAIASLPQKVVTFPELCHGCGGCRLVCPTDAITEGEREVGVVEYGNAGAVAFIGGRLRVGEAQSPPLIRAVLEGLPSDGLTIVDAPPGTSCPVIAAVQSADYVLLVTEPTPFGLHDLKLAIEMLRLIGRPFGVVVNRADVGDDKVERYCALENVEILLNIPDKREIAEAYSRGVPAIEAVPKLAGSLASLIDQITRHAGAARAGLSR
ncbi:MAG TPA: ATP-binding protein [Acidobacteriota bacterium]|nr:ATP-binding protein [Acidobacteriota bacterium]